MTQLKDDTPLHGEKMTRNYFQKETGKSWRPHSWAAAPSLGRWEFLQMSAIQSVTA